MRLRNQKVFSRSLGNVPVASIAASASGIRHRMVEGGGVLQLGYASFLKCVCILQAPKYHRAVKVRGRAKHAFCADWGHYKIRTFLYVKRI